jgi:hypothetical protein
MTSRIFAASAAILSLALAPAAFADESDANTTSSNPSLETNDTLSKDSSGDITESDTNQAGVAGQTTTDTSKTGTTTGSTSNMDDQMKMSARSTIAPHSILMQTALTSARDQIQGLKTQLKAMENTGTSTTTQGQSAGISGSNDKIFQSHVKELRNDLSLAQNHEKELKSNLSKFPQLRNQDDYKNLSTSLQAVNDQLKGWQDKVSSKTYWQNQEQARTDLDGLEQRLNTAIDRTRSFNSSMDVNWVG